MSRRARRLICCAIGWSKNASLWHSFRPYSPNRCWPMPGRLETALRYLLTGGEALHRYPSPGLPFTVVNNYGPTECTVVATSGVIPACRIAGRRRHCRPPSVSRSRTHKSAFSMSDGRPVAPGQVGEIYIAGTSVARGYRNSPDATAERFLPDSLSPIPARGCIEPATWVAFSRTDKLRSAAVSTVRNRSTVIASNPDEIVCVLNRHPGVAASAVVARGQGLVPRVWWPTWCRVKPRRSRRPVCANSSPPVCRITWFRPRSFKISALPSNSNGKLNRGALPDPAAENRIEDAGYRAPSTPTEEQLVQILAAAAGQWIAWEPTTIFSCSGFTPCWQLRLPCGYTSASAFNSVFDICSRPKRWRAWPPSWIAS